MSCQGNLSQLTTAFHKYAGTNQDKLPAGTVPHPDLPPEQRLSWAVVILPHIEQDSVHKQFDLTRGPGDPRNEKPANTRIKSYTCPSGNGPVAVIHYVGISGVGADAATLPLGHPRAGIFGHDRSTALTKEGIPDGMSNTLMLIETANEPGHWAYGGRATVRAFEPGAAATFGPGGAFGGFHGDRWVVPPSCNVGLADGSCRGLSNDIDPALLEALATVAGREALPANW